MFAGVLDAGQDEVFLGGTRLKRFMESVEKATGSIPPSMPQQTEPAAGDAHEAAEAAEVIDAVEAGERASASQRTPSASVPSDWAGLLAAGASFLEQLGKTIGSSEPRTAGSGLPAGLVARDDHTGQSYLKLPLPDEGTVQKIVDLLSVFTGRK